MLENIANNIMKKEKEIETVGNYDPEAVDEPKRNPLHPEAMIEEQIDRYGMCHEMARKFAEENEGVVYATTNGKHSIGVKDGKVFDYVLGYDLDISLEEYLKKVPYAFEKK
ncbi:MAG: hypothetical protein WA063_04875 [Minisyncoccia bacterium]